MKFSTTRLLALFSCLLFAVPTISKVDNINIDSLFLLPFLAVGTVVFCQRMHISTPTYQKFCALPCVFTLCNLAIPYVPTSSLPANSPVRLHEQITTLFILGYFTTCVAYLAKSEYDWDNEERKINQYAAYTITALSTALLLYKCCTFDWKKAWLAAHS